MVWRALGAAPVLAALLLILGAVGLGLVAILADLGLLGG